ANRASKSHSNFFDAFGSYNYPILAEAGIRIECNDDAIAKPSSTKFQLLSNLEERVVMIRWYPGLTQYIFEAMTSDSDLKGLVIQTFGMGNAPTESWLEPALRSLIARG